MSCGVVDLLVIGGGITGLSLAVEAARRGLKVALVDPEPFGGVSTQRSGALVRTHYADPLSARLALRGLEMFESFEERYGGPSGFKATGFAYVPELDEVDSGAFASRIEMLRGLGVETQVLGAPALAALDPSLDISDAGVVAYEPRSGYANPELTTTTLERAVRDTGAALFPGTSAQRLLVGADGRICGAEVRRADGARRTIEAANVALCAGAWSARLAGTVDVDLPIQPTAVKLAFVERTVETHLTVIDAPGGIYLRPDGQAATLVGRRTWTDEPLSGPDSELPEVDGDFLRESAERLAHRLPSAAGARVMGSRAGMLDMTPDGLPLVGPVDATDDGPAVPGLWLCCGWSGTGFKTGPAVGEALATWIDTGIADEAFGAYALTRGFAEPAGAGAGAVRSPH
jgi:sarcosine oxidase subunit beta